MGFGHETAMHTEILNGAGQGGRTGEDRYRIKECKRENPVDLHDSSIAGIRTFWCLFYLRMIIGVFFKDSNAFF